MKDAEEFEDDEGLAGVEWDDFGDDAECWKDQHVNFRMTEKPEEMLPQQRAPTAADA